MSALLSACLVIATASQSPSAARAQADQLAREGRTAEAMAAFERILAQDPTDTEARLWLARLELRRGQVQKAETGFRAVLAAHPSDIDAQIGLGAVLTRKGDWGEALNVLLKAERSAGNNGDLFAALARAYRRAGDDRRALEYFTQARTLSPTDPDVIDGFAAVAQAYGHAIELEGFAENLSPGPTNSSATFTGRVRVAPRLHVHGLARIKDGASYSDAVGGGGLIWRVGRATTASAQAVGGRGNIALPAHDVSGDIIHYTGLFEVGGSVRILGFSDVDVIAGSPMLAWDQGRWRIDTRYTYSRSNFTSTDESSGDHSVLLRGTWRRWRRTWLNAGYAYGIESFEDLTADRIGSLGATTAAVGVRVNLPSLTTVHATWEHQWRSNSTTLNRFTVALTQAFP